MYGGHVQERYIHDTKIGIIVREDLQTWQKLNITAFLAPGIAAYAPEIIGEDYEDGSGQRYLPVLTIPVFVFAASAERMQRTRRRAVARGVPVALYTMDMFKTNNDIDNRAVVKRLPGDDLDLVGLLLRAERKIFDKIVGGLQWHP